MRKGMLQRIHQDHMGIEKSKRRARDVLYWPGMNSQISDIISRCTTCLEHQRQNMKEPMIPSRVPSKPWEIVATDLFTWDKCEYLIIAKRTITKNRFVSMRSHETPRTESDKHWDQNKANV